ncbi:MAG: PIN domain-containing protein [Cyclobacteriaceae bacterium]|nr:PIN domain-containing protein [Cyclobacteriaceae bacterium]
MPLKVFLDTNIFLDHCLDRDAYSTEVVTLCDKGIIDGYCSTATFFTIAYFLQKYSVENRIQLLRAYNKLFFLLNTTGENFEEASSSRFSDLEDAFQYFTACNEEEIEYLITNNVKDFKTGTKQISIIIPKQFIEQLKR